MNTFEDLREKVAALELAEVNFLGPDGKIAKKRRALRGADLACWCRLGEPCHADVLLRVVNAFK